MNGKHARLTVAALSLTNLAVLCELLYETARYGPDTAGMVMVSGYVGILAVTFFLRKEITSRLSEKGSRLTVLPFLSIGVIQYLSVSLYFDGLFDIASGLFGYLLAMVLILAFSTAVVTVMAIALGVDLRNPFPKTYAKRAVGSDSDGSES